MAYFLAALIGTIISAAALRSNSKPISLTAVALVVMCAGLTFLQWMLLNWDISTAVAILFPKQLTHRIVMPAWLLCLTLLLSLKRTSPQFHTTDVLQREQLPNRRLAYDKTTDQSIWPITSLCQVFVFIGIGVCSYCALPYSPMWDDIIQENGFWMLMMFMGTIVNATTLLSMMHDRRSGATGERWVFWIVVAQLATISAVMISQIASFSEFCLALTIITCIVAIATSIYGCKVAHHALLIVMVWIATVLVANFRFSSNGIKPLWLILLLTFFPSFVAVVDRMTFRWPTHWRVGISFLTSVVLAAIAILYVWQDSLFGEQSVDL